jgi:error-prone DNA polymerase
MTARTGPAYIEFATRSNFSFLRAASGPEELVVAACLLGHAAMGLADRNTVAGVVRAWSQSKTIELPQTREIVALPFHPGCRLVFSDGTPDILAYPRDRGGWGNLCRMLTRANDRGQKGAPDLLLDDLLDRGAGLSLAVCPRLDPEAPEAASLLHTLRERFADCVRLAVAPAHDGHDRFRLAQAAALAQRTGLALMAVNDVLYHAPERRPLQDVVTAIRMNVPVAQAGVALSRNAERYLKPPAEMARLFARHPEALAETVRFASELRFSLDELKYNYPDELTEGGRTQQEELEKLTWNGALTRFPYGFDGQVRETIARELALVEEMNYAGYFLTVRDVVVFAKRKGILCQGRGSAANSLICYCLGITDVGPDVMGSLLFERFVSKERGEPPDIDVDFEHERRDEVIAYIYEKYSRRRTALAAAVTSYRGRSALREVSKAMGFSEDVRAALSGSIWGWSSSRMGETEAKAAGLKMADPLTRHVIARTNDILGFPRHLSQHVGGFVITNDRLDELMPIVRTAMAERKMVEWDKDDLDSVGVFKVDILALGMLSCLRRCFDLLETCYSRHYPRRLTLATLPKERSEVYAMIQRADTIGVFQIESRAQMSMLPRLKPKEFYDLVIEVAIVRPGPIQGDMVHPYLRRREGKEKVDYVKPELEAILKKTLGVPLFQEQAMRIAIDAAGFAPDKADKLRRAMATFRRNGTIGKLKEEFIDGMIGKGYPAEFARRCFSQIEGFGEYGFPEAHAASFALLVYASAWFKAFYPDLFCAAILNSQPMGFYSPGQLVRDAREHGVEVRAPDVNASDWDCSLEDAPFEASRISPRHAAMRGTIRTSHAVRLGLRQVKGLSKDDADRLVRHRGAGYVSVRELWLRSGLQPPVLRRLAEADGFRSMGLDRRAALWEVRALGEASAAERLPLFERPQLSLREQEPAVTLPEMPQGEHVIRDYRTLSLSLKAHPVSFLRQQLDAERVTRAIGLETFANGRRIAVAGLVLVRQRPGTAKGVIFMTIEDETGVANIIVWKKVFERFRSIVLGGRFVRVCGRLQSQSGVIHVVAETIEDLTPRLAELCEEAVHIDSLANADEVRRPGMDRRDRTPGHARLLKETRARPVTRPDAETLSREAGSVMPKGRNFH